MNEIRFNPPQSELEPEAKLKSEPIASNGGINKNLLTKKDYKNKIKFVFKVLISIVILIAIGFGTKYLFFLRDQRFAKHNYSAVFLSNGQVYFGNITNISDSEIVMENVYYLQVNENGSADKNFGTLNQSRFNLVKLGQELHGPTNEMFINRSQVVFREYLRDDSKVVEIIKNYN